MSGQAKERWEIDGDRSELLFSLRHIVISAIHGRFGRWGGEMILDHDAITRSQVHVWIDLDSIDTASEERDAHLRSAEFLDVEHFPRAQFDSTDVAPRLDGKARLTGRLLLHGIGHYVDLDVTAQRTWSDDRGVMRAAYVVRGKIDRQRYGLHWNQDLDVGGVVVGDKVDLEARVELVRIGENHVARFGRADTGAPTPAP